MGKRTSAILMALGVVLSPATLLSQNETANKTMRATRVNSHAPQIDGRLDDPVWKSAQFVSGFRQRQPEEGAVAKNRSEVAIVYDDDAIYIAARLHCETPDDILSTVSRRDNGSNSERIIVSLDTYKDERTAYSFAVTAAGTRLDYYHSSDNEYSRDYQFNPVWEARTVYTEDGWTAEMKIPFTQLRFNKNEEQVWGINMNRWVPTSNEDSYWIVVPKDAQGWSSRMGDLTGIIGIAPSKRIELLPYGISSGTVASDPDPDDPFDSDGRSAELRVGGDVKIGVGPNLTLDGTVNPDFGQVEADPAEVNLSAFETFFDERRPFFTEGSSLLSSGGAGYFYSRRIGASPSGEVDGDYVDSPNNTSILGAAKLTGRLDSGMSIGVLSALTAEEKANVYDATSNTTEAVTVEPTTGWGVISLQQEFGENASTVGGIFTAVERDISDDDVLAETLRKRAYTGGAEWELRFKGGDYELSGNVGFSNIRGTTDAITAAQTSSARYFQRPDADYVEVDTTATSMSGWVARSLFEKNAGDWLWGGSISLESPGFELNDIGRIGSSDDINFWAGGRYRNNTPAGIYQDWWTGFWTGAGSNFGGDHAYSFYNFESSMTFKNFYGVWGGYEFNPSALSDNQTRGGPLMKSAASWNVRGNLWSNRAGRFSWWVFARYSENDVGSWNSRTNGGVTIQPGSRWSLSVDPSYSIGDVARQYVDEVVNGPAETFDTRYIFALLDRTTISARIRLNYAFTPDFTLEGYAEPFATSGEYTEHGELVAARSNDLRRYGSDGTTITRDPDDGSFTVTDGADTFELENLDFNFVSFRTNLVLRWEYSPGSTLFLVWQQNRSESDDVGTRSRFTDFGDAFSADGDNFFAIKLTYWIPFN